MKNLFIVQLFLIICIAAEAQDSELENKYRHQLQLIDSVREFITNDLQLNIINNFYTDWETQQDSMYVCLYVSRSDRISAFYPGILHFRSYRIEDSAIAESMRFKLEGYQTLIYKTAGESSALLSTKLLSYPDEAIAFIMVHEAVHQHIHWFHVHPPYPYDFEECLCDAVANSACTRMAEKPGFFEPQKALKQKEIFEKTFAFVNKERTKLNSMKLAKQNKFFKSCTAQMKKMVRDGNQFQKDRMIYEINNAYFLRMEPYATHYFEVQNMLSKSPTINDVIADIYENTDFKLKRDPFLEYFWNP